MIVRHLSKYLPHVPAILLFTAIMACARPGQTEIIYVTATFPGGERVIHGSPTPNDPTATPIQPSPNPTRSNTAGVVALDIPDVPEAQSGGGTYTVKAGDTLAIIANSAGTTVEALLAANNLSNPDLLFVGQLLTIPEAQPTVDALPTQVASIATPNSPAGVGGVSMKLIPDSELVYGPTVANFDLRAYLKLKNGFLRAYSDEIDGEYVAGIELIDEVAKNYSVNPRLLLALLEYRGGWIESATVSDQAQSYPYGLLSPGRTGLYMQVLDAANALSAGYYGWKYRGLNTITFGDGRSVTLSPELNPGTAALQYFFALYSTLEQWTIDVGPNGFFQTYLSMFGDPFISAYEPILPLNLTQPTLTFPFSANETWYFTGGPHGGYNTGSAWASIDFAPPAPPDSLLASQGFCYISPYWVTAVAAGVIARSGKGFVILDLDFDGNEYTGWTIVYLHIADNEDLVAEGTQVQVGDRLGHPSCTGGFSSATHLHFGRRYNGEWIPVDCFDCPQGTPAVPMILSGWTVSGFQNQEYQGTMTDATGGFRRAEQGRDDPINEVRYDK